LSRITRFSNNAGCCRKLIKARFQYQSVKPVAYTVLWKRRQNFGNRWMCDRVFV